MLGRYAELKAQLPPGTILFYQVGTFLETFEEDAKKISQALSIRLTSREAAGYAGGRVPLAGVPNHALQEHLATLLRKGHSVAVAEQRPHPTKPKQFTREVTQILTPGTVIEDNVLWKTSRQPARPVCQSAQRFAGCCTMTAIAGEAVALDCRWNHIPAVVHRE